MIAGINSDQNNVKIYPEESFMPDMIRDKLKDAIAVICLVATAYSTYWVVKAILSLARKLA